MSTLVKNQNNLKKLDKKQEILVKAVSKITDVKNEAGHNDNTTSIKVGVTKLCKVCYDLLK